MGGHQVAPNPHAGRFVSGRLSRRPDSSPRTMRAKPSITREEQDRVRAREPPEGDRGDRRRALPRRDRAHRRADDRRRRSARSRFDTDEGPRRDTSLEALATLKPAFHVKGTVTAGNSSQTSDGAAAVVVMSASARAGARPDAAGPLRRLRDRRRRAGALRHRPGARRSGRRSSSAGLTLDQIDLVELNEAFAAQVLACLRELPIDPRPAERQRRRHRARPPARLHRREADDDAAARDAAARGALRHGDDVRRRRDGRGGDLRTRELAEYGGHGSPQTRRTRNARIDTFCDSSGAA